jgi:hypothetical protein
MEHQYAKILRAIADGKVVQWVDLSGEWHNSNVETILRHISAGNYPPSRYRVKPATITINGVEVPEPVREALEHGQEYWVVNPLNGGGFNGGVWDENNIFCVNWLKRGLIHLTKESAEQHARALIMASGGEV